MEIFYILIYNMEVTHVCTYIKIHQSVLDINYTSINENNQELMIMLEVVEWGMLHIPKMEEAELTGFSNCCEHW